MFFSFFSNNSSGFASREKQRIHSQVNSFQYNLQDYPRSLDWREAGVITDIQNQNNCACCYAFSSLAALESLLQIKKKGSFNFSEQEILDCSDQYQNRGCVGGLPQKVYDYIKSEGIATESDYSYTGEKNRCQKIPLKKSLSELDYVVLNNNVMSLIAAVQFGPVAVNHNVTFRFKNYKQGVLDEEDCKINNQSPNHSSLLVGYNLESEVPYFIMKNSWGKNWGAEGYFHLKIGELSTQNQGVCLLAKFKTNVLPLWIESEFGFSW